MEVNVRLPNLDPDESNRLISSPIRGDSSIGARRTFWAQDQNIDGPAGYASNLWAKNVSVEVGRYSIGVGLEFEDAAVGGSGTTRILVSFSNLSNTRIDLTGVSLEMDLTGTGLNLAAVPDPSFLAMSGGNSACTGARFEALGNGMRLSGARINRGAICRLAFSVTAVSGGNRIMRLPSGAVLNNEGITNPSEISATLTVASLLSAAIGFQPNLLEAGGIAELVVEIVNTELSDGTKDYEGAAPSFVLDLPAWASVTGPANTTCEAAAATVSEGQLVLNGGIFRGSSSCSISAPVRVDDSNSYSITLPAGSISTTGIAGSVTNMADFTAVLRVVKPPVLSVSSPPEMIGEGRTGSARLRLRNPNPPSLNPEGFSSLSLSVWKGEEIEFRVGSFSSGCAGFDNALQEDGSLVISGITLPAESSCEITLAVSGDTAGLHESQAGTISVQEVDLLDTASAVIHWRVVSNPVVRIAPVGDAPDSEIAFRLAVDIENFNEVPVGFGPAGMRIDLPRSPGVMLLGADAPVVTGCGAAVLAAAAGEQSLSLSGGGLAAQSVCSVELSLIGPVGGDYIMLPAPLELEYGSVPIDPVTLTLLSTHAELQASRRMRVLSGNVNGIEACAALEEAEPAGTHALPGACVEVTVVIANPETERKTARDIMAQEALGEGMSLASIDTGSFARVEESSRVSDLLCIGDLVHAS